MAANKARIPLAKMAVEETGMGVMEDKVIKNHYASSISTMLTANTKTVGVLEEDPAFGIKKTGADRPCVAAVIPTTNPTSTAIFKALLCLRRATPSSSARTRAPRSARRRPRASSESGGQGGRAGEHHRLHRVPESGADGRTDARGGYHPRHRRPRHGTRGVFLRQTGAGRRRATSSSTRRRISSWPSARSSIPRRLTTA